MSEQKGFTLIEVLVAITILVTVVIAPLVVISDAFLANRLTANSLRAQFFAQSTIEYVRYVRDTNILNQETKWLKGLEQCNITTEDANTICNITFGSDGGVEEPTKGTKRNNTQTCDGKDPKPSIEEGVQYTTTLTLETPEQDTGRIYADVTVCVSWSEIDLNNNQKTEKYEINETLFQWIIADN